MPAASPGQKRALMAWIRLPESSRSLPTVNSSHEQSNAARAALGWNKTIQDLSDEAKKTASLVGSSLLALLARLTRKEGERWEYLLLRLNDAVTQAAVDRNVINEL